MGLVPRLSLLFYWSYCCHGVHGLLSIFYYFFKPTSFHLHKYLIPYQNFFTDMSSLSAGVRRLYREVVLLTEDRNLRVKAHARDVPVRDLLDFAQWAGVRWGQGSEGPAYACKNVLVRGYCSATVLGEFLFSKSTCFAFCIIAKYTFYELCLYF